MRFQKIGRRWIRRGDDTDENKTPEVVPAADIQMEEPAAPAAQIEQIKANRPEASDKPSFRLDEDALVKRMSFRIISTISIKVERLITKGRATDHSSEREGRQDNVDDLHDEN